MHRNVASGLVVATTLFVVGCPGGGSSGPDFLDRLAPVSGTVTVGGQPAEGATVTFLPDQPECEPASGRTDANGSFTLVTLASGASMDSLRGAVPGRYRVTVSWILTPDGKPVAAGTTDADAMAQGAKETLPPSYSSSDDTTLTATVPDGGGTLDFPITK